MKNDFKKYYQAVKYLESMANLPEPEYLSLKKGRSLFLKRFAYFLKLLGNPHKNLKYIHIGGTSGKGSVATMIQEILTEAGYTTGLYLSPHPTTTIERIKVDRLLIGPDEFADLINQIKPKIDLAYQKSPYGRPSYFEILTALAFLYFKEKKCDYAVLEVGLGGKYDATNIIPRAEATVINLIDYDHTHLLGETLTKIAEEKAAIIKPKTAFFTTGLNHYRVLEILKKTCLKNKAKFNVVNPPKTRYQLQLLGQHQQNNAALAAAVCRHLGVAEAKIKSGLAKVKLSCRTEIIQKNPMIILDGAHNASKMKTTLETIKNLTRSTGSPLGKFEVTLNKAERSRSTLSGTEGLTYQKLYLIIALTKTKNPKTIFKNIQSLAAKVFISRYQSSERKCYPPLELAKKMKLKKPAEIYLDAKTAFNQARKQAGKNDLILVTGSFYLAGELRQHWRNEESLLEERKI